MIGAKRPPSWYEASARMRIAALVDAGSFREILGPVERVVSPHLAMFDLPVQFDDGVVIGTAMLEGRPILVAAQEGRFMGGAIGEVHGAKIVGILRLAASARHDTLLLLDTGGVRLQEANAGETAVAEIMRAVVEARWQGGHVIALVGGRYGCFGGGGLIAATCSAIIVSEQGRIGVTGPEVIETNCGIEEFDAADRGLVWRTYGGKHRYLLGGADVFVADDIDGFRAAAIVALGQERTLTEATLLAEHERLTLRLRLAGAATDAATLWRAAGIETPELVPDLADDAFTAMANTVRRPTDGAR